MRHFNRRGPRRLGRQFRRADDHVEQSSVSGVVDESQAIDQRGLGRRANRMIESWCETKGMLNSRADVTPFGRKHASQRPRETQT
jgi:hypothetical protein